MGPEQAVSDDVTIGGVWVKRVGGENDPHAQVTVEVEVNGQWIEVIREPLASSFSHCVTALGIRADATQRGIL